ncbi:sodium/glutamate symporter [Vibrio sp.]|nr:sodium/glutamate symporter [Vibrio sp.]
MNQVVISIGAQEAFLFAVAVLILGHVLKLKISALDRYNIPEPIIGGLLVSVGIAIAYSRGYTMEFDLPLQNTFMLMFFATVGLTANYKQLAKGGAKVFLFLVVASIYIVLQNAVGVGMATALGMDPLMGLLAGSITLSGGHGTGAAWASTFSETYGIHNTLEIAIASATFGLVIGGIIGGPVGNRLCKEHNLKSEYGTSNRLHEEHPDIVTYNEQEQDRVTPAKVVEIAGILFVCVVGSGYAYDFISSLEISWLRIPSFVYALFIGVFITNVIELTKVTKLDMETVDILGTVSLNLFLAMALMSLKLWEIMDLALPFLAILSVQTIVMALFAYNITYRAMGKGYDAAVISSGHCGFGMGATPTAVMNMGSIVGRYGPSPQAFMVVPIVGAFFIDVTNLIIIQGYISFIAP